MKMRLMYVQPTGVNRTWDIILMDDRQNARVHLNPEGTEFIDLVILEGGGLGKAAPVAAPSEYKSDEFVTSLDMPLEGSKIPNRLHVDDSLRWGPPTGHNMPF